MFLAQGHKAAPVPPARLEPTLFQSRVKHSTTEHLMIRYIHITHILKDLANNFLALCKNMEVYLSNK